MTASLRPPASSPLDLTCWVVTDGRVGIEIQAAGLARSIGLDPEIKRLKASAPWRWLPPRFWLDPLAHLAPDSDRLAPPWPDVLVGCGRMAVAASSAVRRAAGGNTFTVQIQDPKLPLQRFDVVVAPRHDGLAGRNVIATLGSMHGMSEAQLAEAASSFAPRYEQLPRPRIGVLIGGNSRTHRLTAGNARTLAARLKAWSSELGAGLIVTPSRRTGTATLSILREALAGCPVEIWDRSGENPYRGMLALSDAFVVTADSVNMACEAAFTGKPIFVAPVAGGTPKFSRFHKSLREAGIARPLDAPFESWHYAPLRETERVAAEIRRRIAAWRGEPEPAGQAEPRGVDLQRHAG